MDPVVEMLASKRDLIGRVAWRFVGRRGYRMDIDDARQVATIAAWKILMVTEERGDRLDGLLAVACVRALSDELREGRVTGVKRKGFQAGHLPAVSLNRPPAGGEDDLELLDLLVDETGERAYGEVLNETVVGRAMAALSERHRFVVYLHFFEGLTQVEVAVILGVSESRVCQIVKAAREKMKPLIDAAAA